MSGDEERYPPIDLEGIEAPSVVRIGNKRPTGVHKAISRLFELPLLNDRDVDNNPQVVALMDALTNKQSVVVFGRQHIGKTSIVCSAITQIREKYDFIVYLSGFEKVNSAEFKNLLKVYTQQSEWGLPELLQELMADYNALLVFDGLSQNNKEYLGFVESIYGALCKLKDPQSAIVFICDSDIRIGEIQKIEVTGLFDAEIKTVFQKEGIRIDSAEIHKLADIYNRMPVYTTIAAEYCRRFLDGDINRFLSDEEHQSLGVEQLLEKQYLSLAPVHIRVLLSCIMNEADLNREKVVRDAVVHDTRTEKGKCIRAIEELRELNFIRSINNGKLDFYPLIFEYCRNKIFDMLASDLFDCRHELLSSFSLMSNILNETERENKKHAVLEFLKYYQNKYNCDNKTLYKKIRDIWCCNVQKDANNFFAGNIINMLICLGGELSNLDFCGSHIENCDFSNSQLNNVNFAGAQFRSCKFMNDFGCVTALAISRENKLIAAGFFSGLIIVWSFSGENFSGEQVVMFDEEHHSVVFDVHFVGNTLWVAGKDGFIRKWAFTANEEDYIFETCEKYFINDSPVRGICVSSDQKKVYIASEDHALYCMDMKSQTCEKLCEKPYRLKCLAINEDETKMAFAGDSNEVTILDISDKNVSPKIILVNNKWIRSIDFYNHDMLICAGDSGHVNIINLANNFVNDILGVDKNKVWVVVSLPDVHAIAAGCDNGDIKIYDALHDHQLLRVLSRHTSWVRCLALNKTILLSGGEDQIICLWNTNGYSCTNTLKGYARRVFSIDTLDVFGDTIVSGHGDHSICKTIFKGEHHSMHPSKIFQCSDQVWSITASDELICAGSDKGDIYIIDIISKDNFKLRFKQNYRHGWIGCVRFSSDGHYLAVGDEQGYIYVFNTQNKYRITTPIHQYQVHAGYRVSCVLFLGELIVSAGEDGFICGYDIIKKCLRFRNKISDDLIYSMSSISESMIICGDSKGMVYQYEINEKKGDIIANCGFPVWSVAHNGSGKIYVGLDNGEVRCYYEGKELSRSSSHTNQVWCLAYILDGNLLISGGEDSNIIVHDGESLFPKTTILGNLPLQGVSIKDCNGLSDMQRNYLCSMGASE